MANNTITAAEGFLAAGVSCGIKKSGKLDLGLLVCPDGADAGAVFTTNKVVSQAVEVCRSHLGGRRVRAVVVNSGNANTCTGRKGIEHAKTMCERTARQIDAQVREVLVASTGIIGEPLPIARLKTGIPRAASKLSGSATAGLSFARAIMTTDTKPKQAVRRLKISGEEVTIAGTVKGAGMIGPNMATTLCFLATDAVIKPELLQTALRDVIGDSLNKLTVDGHQSTNDTAILLASGKAGNRAIERRCPRYRNFAAALLEVCDDLARQMALDAEGASRIFKVVVRGAATQAEAARAARAIADYPLVKCAVHGGDPNWGRIICAAGSCGVKLDPAKLTCRLDSVTVFRNGSPARFDRKRAAAIVAQQEHTITVELGAGKAQDFCYGCDLSYEYVRINAEYHT